MRRKAQLLTRPWRLPVVVLLLAMVHHAALAFGAEPKIDVEVESRGDAFIVDAVIDVQVPLEVAWDVFIDIDHMASFLDNMTFSKVISRTGNVLVARQDGIARFGLLSFSFESEREIRLEPMTHIATRNLSGTLKRMQSDATFVPNDHGVRIKYDAEIVPDSLLARMFGHSFVRHEIREQFVLMSKEMLRRYAIAAGTGDSTATPARSVEGNGF